MYPRMFVGYLLLKSNSQTGCGINAGIILGSREYHMRGQHLLVLRVSARHVSLPRNNSIKARTCTRIAFWYAKIPPTCALPCLVSPRPGRSPSRYVRESGPCINTRSDIGLGAPPAMITQAHTQRNLEGWCKSAHPFLWECCLRVLRGCWETQRRTGLHVVEYHELYAKAAWLAFPC